MTSAVQLKTVGDNRLPALVLVHGWGHCAAVWQPLVELLEDHFCIHLLDLPGYADHLSDDQSGAQNWQLQSLLESFYGLPIEPAIWCGWSLGGMLATLYAERYPDQVSSLVTIASNGVFTQRHDWPNAMPSADFKAFQQALADNSISTLSRFLSLVCQGADSARTDFRFLKSCLGGASSDTLMLSLDLLNQLDTRAAISRLTMPQLHIFGAQDALVPVTASEALTGLNPACDIEIIADAGHALLLSHREKIAENLKSRVSN